MVQEKNYYPFGLEHKGYNFAVNGRKHSYSFNGKEFDQSLSMNTFDLGARHYDPTIGRFMVMDPMTDFYNNQSPYVMANNNPVGYVDLYGLGIWNWLKALGRKASNGVKKLFSGNQCDCSSSGDSLAQAWRRPDNIFPASRNRRRKRRRKRNRKKATTSTITPVVDNSPSIPNIDASIGLSPLVLETQQLPELGIVNPRPVRKRKAIQTPIPTAEDFAKINISLALPFHPNTDSVNRKAITDHTLKNLKDLIKTLKEYPQIKVAIDANYRNKNGGKDRNSIVKFNNGTAPVQTILNNRAKKMIDLLISAGVSPSQLIQGSGGLSKKDPSVDFKVNQ
ncbi:RHS repeat domain-containing protein [Aquimarina spinulae]|uniref:RHS repeat domain-containing protein n=1 Tax=Aquimarina spinulae TaxID=1192023 RepID=UPI001F23D3F4|nr:RHS repeat-associated core domain-containing protein [Aquimarina spinulae]